MKNPPSKTQDFVKKYFVWILFAAIVGLAIFFRFYQLNHLPPGLHPDEAANGLDIVQRIFHNDWRIIYNTNGPREALFFYMQAIFVATMGNTILALRVAPALMGVVATIVVFFATKEWFNRRTALITSFFFAINPWVVTIQRDGFRASLVPLFIALTMLFGGKAYKSNKMVWYVLAAISFGLGFYTYTAFAMFSAALLFGLGFLLITRRDWLKTNWKKLLVSLGVLVVILLPLIVVTVKDPAGSTARAGGTSFLNKDLNHGKPLLTLVDSTTKTLLQYNFTGDENNRHNLAGQPLLNTFVGLMFILGIGVSIFYFRRPKYAMVLAILGAMMLPAILTAEGLPHALRSIGTAVPALMLAGIGVDYLLRIWYRTFPINTLARSLGLAVICVLMGLSLVQAYRQYFVAWAQDPKTYEAYNEGDISIANYVLAHGAGRTNYIIMGGYEANPIQYLTYNKANYTLLDQNGLENVPLSGGAKLFIIPAGDNRVKDLETLKAKFPDGKSSDVNSDVSGLLLFSTFEVSQ